MQSSSHEANDKIVKVNVLCEECPRKNVHSVYTSNEIAEIYQ